MGTTLESTLNYASSVQDERVKIDKMDSMDDEDATFYSVKEFELNDFVADNNNNNDDDDVNKPLTESQNKNNNAWEFYASTDLDYGDEAMKHAREIGKVRTKQLLTGIIPMQNEDFTNKGKDDIADVMDLLQTDRQVDSVQKSASRTQEEETFTGLIEIDRLVDQAGDKGETEVSDSMVEPVLRQMMIPLNDNADPQISELLNTDMEVDKLKVEDGDMQAIDCLLETDQEVDGATEISKSCEAQHYSSTSQHGEQENSARLQKDMDMQQRAYKYATSSNLPNSIVSLYATDLHIDQCSSVVEGKDDLSAILDILHIDREMDRTKQLVVGSYQEEMLPELLKIDRLVDQEKGTCDGNFVDPLAAKFLQHEMQSVSASLGPDLAIFDLLCTDMDVDNNVIHHENLACIESLLLVDREIDKASGDYKSSNDFDDVKEFFIVDQELEKVPKLHKNEKVVLSLAANSQLPRSIVELYSTDLEVDGRKKSLLVKEDDVGCILSLLEIDRQVDTGNKFGATTSFAFDNSGDEAATRAILEVDQLVDRKEIGDRVDFVINIKDQIVQQHVAQVITSVERSDELDHDIFELLNTDLEVDKFELNAAKLDFIKPLLHTDREVDNAESSRKWNERVFEIVEFLKTDFQFANDDVLWKAPALECLKEHHVYDKQKPSNIAKQAQKPPQEIQRSTSRSIFSVKEKEAARKHTFKGGNSQEFEVQVTGDREVKPYMSIKTNEIGYKVDDKGEGGRSETMAKSTTEEVRSVEPVSPSKNFASNSLKKAVPRRSIFTFFSNSKGKKSKKNP